ncbi:MAG: nucleotidyltransferase domain-containing protein [Chitinivibrionales bacterium]|nr:nucleotidyltransferase domain-containing protein [Chitinivibrionales bacterium]
MVAVTVVESARMYLRAVGLNGIPVSFGVLFGSQARGTADDQSDIDLLVVSPRFDGKKDRRETSLLWRLTIDTDTRIEPVPVGEIEWEKDDSRAIVEIARREGHIIRV